MKVHVHTLLCFVALSAKCSNGRNLNSFARDLDSTGFFVTFNFQSMVEFSCKVMHVNVLVISRPCFEHVLLFSWAVPYVP